MIQNSEQFRYKNTNIQSRPVAQNTQKYTSSSVIKNEHISLLPLPSPILIMHAWQRQSYPRKISRMYSIHPLQCTKKRTSRLDIRIVSHIPQIGMHSHLWTARYLTLLSLSDHKCLMMKILREKNERDGQTILSSNRKEINMHRREGHQNIQVAVLIYIGQKIQVY